MTPTINFSVARVFDRAPAWGRLLLWGVLASLLLHAAMLDGWRATQSLKGAAGVALQPPALYGRLQLGSASSLPVEPIPERLGRQVALPPAPVKPERASALKRSAQSGAPSRPEKIIEPVAVADTALGLRPLSPAEGLVAYRLLILAQLRAVPALSQTIRLGVRRSAAGLRQIEFKTATGEAALDQAWLVAIESAVQRSVAPEVLNGQAFELELEFVP